MLGEYRNVLGEEPPGVESRVGDPENELGRSEPMLGEKLRGLDARGLGLSAGPLRIGPAPWLNDGLGALNEGRDGVI